MQTSQDYIFHILKGDVPIVHRGSYTSKSGIVHCHKMKYRACSYYHLALCQTDFGLEFGRTQELQRALRR